MTQDDVEDVYRFPFTKDVAPSRATYLAVADALDCGPLELPPLGRRIDTDSIDALFEGNQPNQNSTVSFEFADCSVTVTHSEIRVDIH